MNGIESESKHLVQFNAQEITGQVYILPVSGGPNDHDASIRHLL